MTVWYYTVVIDNYDIVCASVSMYIQITCRNSRQPSASTPCTSLPSFPSRSLNPVAKAPTPFNSLPRPTRIT
ncbi:hypothetical protein BDR04DRAFT_658955 [Suillus decipiens]|nr:hypothetical protein BDR04DRAFT_658955 [Suillus decipiens]